MGGEEEQPRDIQKELRDIGALIRTSELPDDIVMVHVIMDVLHGIHEFNLEVNAGELAEMLASALVSLGGYHRSGSCAW